MASRFQADADFNQRIVLGLRRRERALDIQDAREGGVLGIEDPEVLRIAADSGRILLSHDRRTMVTYFTHFLQTNSSPGVIIVSQDLDIGTAIEGLLIIWAASEAEEWRDQLGLSAVLAGRSST